MHLIEAENLSGKDYDFYHMIYEENKHDFFKISANQIVKFLEDNPDFNIDKMFITKSRISPRRKDVQNPIFFIMKNTQFVLESPDDYIKMIKLISERASDKLILNEMPMESSDLYIAKFCRGSDKIFNYMSDIILNNKMTGQKENDLRAKIFIECYESLYNTLERKDMLFDFSKMIKNNYLYILDGKSKKCANFFSIIDTVAHNVEKKKKIYESIYSNFYSSWFSHFPVYPNHLKIDREKFKKMIRKFSFFDIQTLPAFDDRAKGFISSLYKQHYEHGIISFCDEHKLSKQQIYFEINGIAFYKITDHISCNYKTAKQKDIAENKLKKYLLETFNPLLFEEKNKQSLLSMLKEYDPGVKHTIVQFYKTNAPLIEKRCLLENTPKTINKKMATRI